jgi:hypothetical protein
MFTNTGNITQQVATITFNSCVGYKIYIFTNTGNGTQQDGNH